MKINLKSQLRNAVKSGWINRENYVGRIIIAGTSYVVLRGFQYWVEHPRLGQDLRDLADDAYWSLRDGVEEVKNSWNWRQEDKTYTAEILEFGKLLQERDLPNYDEFEDDAWGTVGFEPEDSDESIHALHEEDPTAGDCEDCGFWVYHRYSYVDSTQSNRPAWLCFACMSERAQQRAKA